MLGVFNFPVQIYFYLSEFKSQSVFRDSLGLSTNIVGSLLYIKGNEGIGTLTINLKNNTLSMKR